MKVILLMLVLFLTTSCVTESTEEQDKKAITTILKQQEKAWSNHNLEGYMQGYWKSDSLQFFGSSGLTLGWSKTLANYKKSYPTKAHTGVLSFKIIAVSKINKEAYSVMGEYHLTREKGNAEGIFMIVLKKINGSWKIIADSSC